jgi:hypothetical protein
MERIRSIVALSPIRSVAAALILGVILGLLA